MSITNSRKSLLNQRGWLMHYQPHFRCQEKYFDNSQFCPLGQISEIKTKEPQNCCSLYEQS